MRLVLVLILAAGMTVGCGRSDVAGDCVRPPDEGQLLDEYARDPVFAIRPPDVRDVAPMNRSRACRVTEDDVGREVSQAAVQLGISPARSYDQAALTALYNP
jgi:hypothetical protein